MQFVQQTRAGRSGSPWRALIPYLLVCVAILGVAFGAIQHHQAANLKTELAAAQSKITQTSNVAKAATLLETVGFTEPQYVGVKETVEGRLPTFKANARNGVPLTIFIRTTDKGAHLLQPSMMFETVGSADEFALLAADVVDDWLDASDIQPDTDRWDEDKLADYFYTTMRRYADRSPTYMVDETAGWPTE